jgi:hypothetical protein
LELHKQKSAQTRACLVNRESARYYMRFPYYSEESITQMLSLQQNKYDEHDNHRK